MYFLLDFLIFCDILEIINTAHISSHITLKYQLSIILIIYIFDLLNKP